jgi:N-acetylglucosamine-6-phosphate deacetylase
MTYTLQGARLVDAAIDQLEAALTVEGGQIRAIGAPFAASEHAIDVSGMIVTPGFIDVHTHGGGGCNLHTTSAEEILTYAGWAPSTGVTAFLIGVVGTPGALPEEQLRTAVRAIDVWERGAEPLGVHLEGPFISERRRGAHPLAWLRLPSKADTERILELAQGRLRVITLASELPGASAMIRRMVAAGVTVSIGHTDATYEQALAAIDLGVTHMTHCCNAMRPLHHRDAGPLGAIVRAPQVLGEIIADGAHLHPAMVEILFRVLGPERTILITDALAAAGSTEIDFAFAGQPAHVVDGVARLEDGTITGSVLTMDVALRNALRMTDATLSQAVGMLTLNPARSVGAADHKGRLQPGYDADIVLLDRDYTLQATICRGRLTYATDEWQAKLEPLEG